MKTMKKLIVAVGMFIGLLGVANAGVISTTFTAVCITSATGMELLSVELGSGTFDNQTYLLLFDTPSIYIRNIANADPVPLGDVFATAGNSRWPQSQMLCPPIIFPSTGSVNIIPTSGGGGYLKVDFTDPQGNGRPIERALIGFKAGTDTGSVVTYNFRKRRTYPEH